MQKIIISAGDVWDYFQKHKEELRKTEHIIAENEEFGVEISLSAENGLPCFVVTADNYQYDEERAISESDCKETVEKLYDDYLTNNFVDDEVLEDSRLDQEDMISERELELDEAISLLLDTVLEEDAVMFFGTETDEICEDLKDHILEYLYRKHGISVRRPMVLEDTETGEEFFEEYPYDSMVFEDEDNPLYKS